VRVVARGKRETVAGVDFEGYGSSCSAYPHHYLTAAAAIGSSTEDVDIFVEKLQTAYGLCLMQAL
jgi:O-phospho-L-seryl-tRNASec:L-selenocysteinyl-tRNA synthase